MFPFLHKATVESTPTAPTVPEERRSPADQIRSAKAELARFDSETARIFADRRRGRLDLVSKINRLIDLRAGRG